MVRVQTANPQTRKVRGSAPVQVDNGESPESEKLFICTRRAFMASAETHEPITAIWGRAPGGPGAEPLVRWSGDFAPASVRSLDSDCRNAAGMTTRR